MTPVDYLDNYIQKSRTSAASSWDKLETARKRAQALGYNIPDEAVEDFYNTVMLESGRSHYNANGRVKESPRDPKDGQVAVGFGQIKPGTIKKWGNLDAYNENDNITGSLLEFYHADNNDPIARRIGYFAGPASRALKQYKITGNIPKGGDFTGTSFQKYIEKTGGFNNIDDYIKAGRDTNRPHSSPELYVDEYIKQAISLRPISADSTQSATQNEGLNSGRALASNTFPPEFQPNKPAALPTLNVPENVAPKIDDAIPEGFQSEPDPTYMASFAQNPPSDTLGTPGMAKMPPDSAQGVEPQLPSQVADPDYLKTLKDNNLDDTPELRDRWQKAIAGEVPEFLSTEMLQKAQDAKTPAAPVNGKTSLVKTNGVITRPSTKTGEPTLDNLRNRTEGLTTSAKVYATKPTPEQVSADAAKNIYGDDIQDINAAYQEVSGKPLLAPNITQADIDSRYDPKTKLLDISGDIFPYVKEVADAYRKDGKVGVQSVYDRYHPKEDLSTPEDIRDRQIKEIASPSNEDVEKTLATQKSSVPIIPGAPDFVNDAIKGWNVWTGRDDQPVTDQDRKTFRDNLPSEEQVRSGMTATDNFNKLIGHNATGLFGGLAGGAGRFIDAVNGLSKLAGAGILNDGIKSLTGVDLNKIAKTPGQELQLAQSLSRQGDDSYMMDLGQGITGAAFDVPRFLLISKIPGLGGAVGTFAIDNLLQGLGKGDSRENITKDTAKGALLGAVFYGANVAGEGAEKALLDRGVSELGAQTTKEALTPALIAAGTFSADKLAGAKNDEAFRSAIGLTAFHLVNRFGDTVIGKTLSFLKNGKEVVGEITSDGEVVPSDAKPIGAIDLTKVTPEEWQKLGGKMPAPENSVVKKKLTTEESEALEPVSEKTNVSPKANPESGPLADTANIKVITQNAFENNQKIAGSPTNGKDNSKIDTTKANKAVTPDVEQASLTNEKRETIAPEPAEISTGEEKPEAEQVERGVRALPKTMEAAGLEKGENLTYDSEKTESGIDRGRAIVKEKGVDAAIEFVRHSNGIEWAPTGYAALEHLRNQEAEIRATDPAKADEIQKKRADFLDEFAEEATKRGQSIVGIKAIEEFAPDRAAYLLNKASQRARKRQISPLEDARITDLGTQLEAERVRSSGLEAQLAEAQKGKSSKKVKTPTYLDTLEQGAESAKTEILTRKIDLSGLAKSKQLESQKGAIGEQRELPADAELVAKYAAGQLHKIDTVENLNKHLVETFGKEIEPHLSDIRQRAYQIRQEARIASLESPTTTAEARRTIIQDIKKEIAEGGAAEKTRLTESAQKEKALTAEAFKTQKADARTEAKRALADQRANDKALAGEAKQRAKDYERNLIAARKAETKGYRESIKAKKQAEKEAHFWDTPLRNIAAEAKTRLETADPKSPDTLSDLASVGAEKFLRDSKGGVPGKRTISPMQFYREMQTEYPNLVTNKNKSEIYKQSYQRIQDAVEAGRNVIELNSAKKAEKVIWEEQGLDTNTQALLIQKATNARRQHEIRSEMANEFNRVSQPLYKRVGREILNAPRVLQTTLNMHQGRQGLFTLLTHPTIAFNTSIPQTIRGFRASKSDFVKLTEQLKQDPMFPLAAQSGLNIAELPRASTDLKGHIEEDQLQSSVTMKLPWVRKSTQGFVLGMNSERLALFKKWAAIGEANGYTFENNPKFFEQAASVANDFTGRGVAPEAIEKTISKMNQLLYAPRLKVSQVKAVNDLFNPFNYFGKNAYDPVMKKIMIQNAVKTVVGFAAMYATLVAMGGKGTDDPDDPDFGKIVFGHTHYDLTGGAGATFKTAYKLIKSIYGYLSGAKQSEYEKPLAIAQGFVRKKLAPWPGAVIDFFTGKNAVGQPANLKVDVQDIPRTMKENIALRMVLPLVVNEITEGVEDGGWSGLAKSGPASVMGVSEQTYAPSLPALQKQLQDAITSKDQSKIGEATKTLQDETRKQYEEKQKQLLFQRKYQVVQP